MKKDLLLFMHRYNKIDDNKDNKELEESRRSICDNKRGLNRMSNIYLSLNG